MTESYRHSLRMVLVLLRLERRYVILLFALALVLAISEAVSVGLLLPITNMMTQEPHNMTTGSLSAWVIRVTGWDYRTMLLAVLGGFVIALVIRAMVTLFNLYFLAAYGEVLRKQLTQRYLERYYMSDLSTASRSHALNATLQEAGQASKLARDVIDLFVNLVVSFAIVGVMVFISPITFMLIAAFGIVAVAADRLYLHRLSMRLGNDRVRINHTITARIRQLVEAIIEVRTLHLYEFAQRYVLNAFTGYGHVIGTIATLRVLANKFVELTIGLFFAATALLYLLKGVQIISIGELGVILVGMLRLGSQLSNVYGLILSISNKLPSLDEFRHTLLAPVGEHRLERLAKTNPEELCIHKLGGQVGGKLHLEIRDYVIRKGQLNVIAGPSGAGKSTLCLILSGLLPADRFEVTIDTHDYRDQRAFLVDLHVVYVPQTQCFFDLTVRENLNLVDGGGAVDAQDVIQRVGLGDWMGEHEDQVLGDRGLKPSIGQLRRLAFVRSVLANPGLLILDEPTAGLDAESERLVIKAIEELSRSVLILVVTHSPTLIDRSRNTFML